MYSFPRVIWPSRRHRKPIKAHNKALQTDSQQRHSTRSLTAKLVTALLAAAELGVLLLARGVIASASYNKIMIKWKKKLLIVASFIVLLPVIGKFKGCWYMESFNSFTVNDICKIKKGMNIYTAWGLLGRPAEYQNYNFSNVMSAQYRSGNLFVEIFYTPDEGNIEEVFFGRGRGKTLDKSGVCVNGAE